MTITHFKGVDWIVAWDAARESHIYLRGGDLVFVAEGKNLLVTAAACLGNIRNLDRE